MTTLNKRELPIQTCRPTRIWFVLLLQYSMGGLTLQGQEYSTEMILAEASLAWKGVRANSLGARDRKGVSRHEFRDSVSKIPQTSESIFYGDGQSYSAWGDSFASGINGDYSFQLEQLNGNWVVKEMNIGHLTKNPFQLAFDCETLRLAKSSNEGAWRSIYGRVFSAQGLDVWPNNFLEEFAEPGSPWTLHDPVFDEHPVYGRVCRLQASLLRNGTLKKVGSVALLAEHGWRVLSYSSDLNGHQQNGVFEYDFDDQNEPLRSSVFEVKSPQINVRTEVTFSRLNAEELSEARSRCYISAYGFPEPVNRRPFWKWVFGTAIALPIGWFAFRRLKTKMEHSTPTRKR